MATSPTPPIARLTRHLRASDLRAAALLATQATHAITDISEGVHQSVWRTLGAPGGAAPDQTRGLTGLIYQSIHSATGLIGRGLDAALTRLEPTLRRLETVGDESPERVAVIAALNGVMGDRLTASANPLALPMTLRYQERLTHYSRALQPDLTLKQQLPQVSAKVLLVIHGLCMNDLQWTMPSATGTPAHANHATALADAGGATPVYLRYNTGLHISDNGLALAAQLEQLLAHWPTAVTELTVLAHSMGGLVIRSAVSQATSAGMRWPQQLKNIFFLGTPQHGAPLERAGNWVDLLLGSTPYSRPFAKLAQLRSAGITDLRYGLVRNQDWHGHDRFRRQPDHRTPMPLPDGVACFTVAASTAAKHSHLADQLVGDGLVPLRSALGQHDTPAHCLQFAPARQFIAYRTSHLALLSSPAITQQLLQWLA
ncbi:MAG: alpha/beta hydrolase [Rhodoferax sp.]|nr:alpha/beta hydrolase [Rhodoferax sp.]